MFGRGVGPPAFAHEYAENNEDAYRQPVYDGCLDALEGREKHAGLTSPGTLASGLVV